AHPQQSEEASQAWPGAAAGLGAAALQNIQPFARTVRTRSKARKQARLGLAPRRGLGRQPH
ncbi:MAG: hypothetical protein FWC78_01865, partial [Defluviitaleaceae bacterium]|nr:hypothetical protein [Defluviitaleaceae bacterium]